MPRYAIANHYPYAAGYSVIGSDGVRDAILAGASAETLAYVLAVEAADGQKLENPVLSAMVDFANWRIPFGGHCVIMAGARTLTGALVPMVGAAPTGNNLVSGDYSRINGINMPDTKWITCNVGNVSLAQDSRHAYTYVTVSNYVNTGAQRVLIGSSTTLLAGNTGVGQNAATNTRINASSTSQNGVTQVTTAGGYGVNRTNSANFTYRTVVTSGTQVTASQAPVAGGFSVSQTTGFQGAFSLYSIGADIGDNLTDIDTRTIALMSAITAAGI
jgi:hypothetical protein